MIDRFPTPMIAKKGFCDICNEEKPYVYTIPSVDSVVHICKDCLEEPDPTRYRVRFTYQSHLDQITNINIGGILYERKL